MILDLRNLPDVPTNKLNSDVCIRLSYFRSRLQHYFQKLLFLLHRILTPYYFFLFTFFFFFFRQLGWLRYKESNNGSLILMYRIWQITHLNDNYYMETLKLYVIFVTPRFFPNAFSGIELGYIL